MEKLPKMVSLKSEPADGGMPVATNLSIPDQYPMGTSLCLNDDLLKKLGLDDEKPEVGDLLHFHAVAKVTHCSDSEMMGKHCNLQIVMMSAEDEADEDEAAEKEMPTKLSPDKLYK